MHTTGSGRIHDASSQHFTLENTEKVDNSEEVDSTREMENTEEADNTERVENCESVTQKINHK